MEGETKSETRSVNMTFRMTPREEKMLELLARYLYLRGLIESDNRSEAIRYSIYFTFNYIRRIIEMERWGGSDGGGEGR